jgi:hypothetical protein
MKTVLNNKNLGTVFGIIFLKNRQKKFGISFIEETSYNRTVISVTPNASQALLRVNKYQKIVTVIFQDTI